MTRRTPKGGFAKLIGAVLGLALLGTACSSGDGSTSAGGAGGSGGTLRIAMSAANVPFPSTPPNQGYEGYRFVGNNIYDALTRLNLDQGTSLPTPQPSLAESWTMAADQMTYTFKLRKGVTFHDGTPFNADAVLFQLNRLKNPKFEYYSETDAANASSLIRYIAKWKKTDAHTVVM